MVFLAYYDKLGGKTDHTQTPYHRDNLYKKDGTFNSAKNSQKERSATCVLTLGNTRKLNCKLNMHNGRAIDEVAGEYTAHTFSLSHGSLFILHPDDEETVIRDYFGDRPTFFKHGGVKFGRSGLSIGLVFRTTVHKREVYRDTGRLVPENEEATTNIEYAALNNLLTQYLDNASIKKLDEECRLGGSITSSTVNTIGTNRYDTKLQDTEQIL